MDKLKMETPDLTQGNIEKLAALFPACVTEARGEDGQLKKAVNFALLRQMLSDVVLEGDEAYEFTWVGKKAAIVEANRPIRKTLRPCPAESVDWDTTENLYIEGDNLEVLKLLQESYLGKVKMIYIDPPYNTGNDFIYRDDFAQSREEYAGETGEIDEETGDRLFRNTDSNGRFHSDWCSMIYSRLLLARNLLTDDGVIFISIDDNEQENLKKICDEVFGASNFIVQIIWKKRSTPPNDQVIGASHEYILAYAKNMATVALNLRERTKDQMARYKNPDNHPKGPWCAGDLSANVKGGRYVESLYYPIINPNTGEEHYPPHGGNWRFNQNKIKELLKNNEISFGDDGKGRPKLKRFLCDVKQGVTYTALWDFVPLNTQGSAEMTQLLGNLSIFDNPKPVNLIRELLKLGTDKDSIVLDFFSGSSTTAHAVFSQNFQDVYDGKWGKRKFIMVQLPELCKEDSEAYKAGYKNICEIGKERIRRAGKKSLELSLERLEKEGVIERYAGESSEIRSLEEVYGAGGGSISTGEKTSQRGTLCSVGSAEASGSFNPLEHCGGTVPQYKGIYPVFESGKGFTSGSGNTVVDLRALEILNKFGYKISDELVGKNQPDAFSFDQNSQLSSLNSKFSVLNSKLSIDTGFRVFKLDGANMTDVYYSAGEYAQGMLDDLVSNIKPGRTGLDLLFGCLLDWGLPLSLPCASEKIQGCTVHTVGGGDLIACFDENIPETVIREIAKRQPLRAVFRDSGFADSPAKINAGEIFKLLAPDTRVKVL